MYAYNVPQQQPQRSYKGCWTCFWILIGAIIIGSLVLAFGAVFFSNQLMSMMTDMIPGAPQMITTTTLPMDAANFDPVQALPGVTTYAGEGAQLVEIDAWNVRADGTLDLTATYSPAPRVEFEFVREVDRPADAPPIGAGGANTGPWYEPVSVDAYQPGQSRHVTSTGGGWNMEYSYTNEGMERDTGSISSSTVELAPEPDCSFADLWREAVKHDAPREAVARIVYNADGYEFTISGVGIYLEFGMDCRLEA